MSFGKESYKSNESKNDKGFRIDIENQRIDLSSTEGKSLINKHKPQRSLLLRTASLDVFQDRLLNLFSADVCTNEADHNLCRLRNTKKVEVLGEAILGFFDKLICSSSDFRSVLDNLSKSNFDGVTLNKLLKSKVPTQNHGLVDLPRFINLFGARYTGDDSFRLDFIISDIAIAIITDDSKDFHESKKNYTVQKNINITAQIAKNSLALQKLQIKINQQNLELRQKRQGNIKHQKAESLKKEKNTPYFKYTCLSVALYLTSQFISSFFGFTIDEKYLPKPNTQLANKIVEKQMTSPDVQKIIDKIESEVVGMWTKDSFICNARLIGGINNPIAIESSRHCKLENIDYITFNGSDSININGLYDKNSGKVHYLKSDEPGPDIQFMIFPGKASQLKSELQYRKSISANLPKVKAEGFFASNKDFKLIFNFKDGVGNLIKNDDLPYSSSVIITKRSSVDEEASQIKAFSTTKKYFV